MTSRNFSKLKHLAPIFMIVLWTAVAIFIAAGRSFWCDEMVRWAQYRMGLIGALKDLFNEPSPFSPGETILIWISGQLFHSTLPEEVWGRLPSIFWAVCSLSIAVSLSELRFLKWMAFFSVSLLSFGVEMRPYSPLLFSGALGLKLLWPTEQRALSAPLRVLIWFTLLFTHIYGICFVGLACAIRRYWAGAVFAALYVAAILSRFHIQKVDVDWYTPISEIIRQTLGTLGNPHKAMIFFAPLFTLGVFALLRRNFKEGLKPLLLFSVALFGPIGALIRSHYPFLPRQTLGALFPFLGFSAYGLQTLTSWLEFKGPFGPYRKQCSITFAVLVCTLSGAVPWLSSYVLKKPPFVNQPIHKIKEAAHEIRQSNAKAVFSVDPCNESSVILYISRALDMENTPPQVSEEISNGLPLSKVCWSERLCLYTIKDSSYCTSSARMYAQGTPVDQLIKTHEPRFEILLHTMEDLPRQDIRSIRLW